MKVEYVVEQREGIRWVAYSTYESETFACNALIRLRAPLHGGIYRLVKVTMEVLDDDREQIGDTDG